MSWNDAFRYLGKMASSPDASRADGKVPMNARIGTGMIEFQVSPFVSAQTFGSLIKPPPAKLNTIRAISRFKVPHLPNSIYRFYLETGDAGSGETFLQVLATPEGEPVELMYCSSLHRLVPESAEEQAFFTGENPDGLGSLEFSLLKGQLESIGIQNLDGVFPAGQDTLTYRRADGSNDSSRPAIRGAETRIDDVSGEHGLRQDVYFMPYSRNIGEKEEYLLISTEIVESKDGDESDSEIHVDFTIGLVVDKASVKII